MTLNNFSLLEKTQEMLLSCKNLFLVPFRRLRYLLPGSASYPEKGSRTFSMMQVCERTGKVMISLDPESHLLFAISGSGCESKLIVL